MIEGKSLVGTCKVQDISLVGQKDKQLSPTKA